MSHEEVVSSYNALDDQAKQAFRKTVGLTRPEDAAPVPPPAADVVPPLRSLLQGMSMLGTPTEERAASGPLATFRGSAASVAALESTATALAKWWATAIGAGGVLAGFTAWRASAAGFWKDSSDAVHVALVLAVAIGLVAVVASIAHIVGADVRARSHASAAQYEARGVITAAYLASNQKGRDPSAQELALESFIASAKASNKQAHITSMAGEFRVDDVHKVNGHVQVHRPDTRDWIDLPEEVKLSFS